MLPRTHLIRIQRSMYARLKGYARQFLGGLSPELKKYFFEYQRDFQSFRAVSSEAELVEQIKKSHVVFCGDYHTLSQAQRTVIRLLREAMRSVKPRKKEVILALEMVRPQDNEVIAKYLARKISEREFLEKISFRKNWGFHWASYRQLFDFAREQGIRIVGVNHILKSRRATLTERDQFAADEIGKLVTNPNRLVFVLIGDLHLARTHLPKAVNQVLESEGLKRKQLIIHQNIERFYWKLVEQGREQQVDVVKIDDDSYCVMNTPPWIKLESHIKWAEQATVNEDWDSFSDAAQDIFDYSDEVREFVILIRRFVGLSGGADDDFSVITPLELGVLRRMERSGQFSPRTRRNVARYLIEFKSFFFPDQKIIFLRTLSPNQMATQASLYLHAKVSGFGGLFAIPKQDFYRYIWVEALGFLGSKMINHKRKCAGPEQLVALVEASPRNRARRENSQIAALALQLLQGGNLRLPGGAAKSQTIALYYKVAKVLGQMLGGALYDAMIDNRVSREQVRQLYCNPFQDPQKARVLYQMWCRRLGHFGYRHSPKNA